VADGSLILWPSAPTAGFASSLETSAASRRDSGGSSLLRYVLVNDANLKTQAYCAECGTKIGQHYVRETGGSRSVFCDFACYCCAAENPAPTAAAGSANLFAASRRLGETK
jgi:hypothetical protein